jgi:hypothetical protein
MPHYRLVIAPHEGRDAKSIFFQGEDAAEALLIAQRHESPAQLWEDDRHVCTLHRSGNDGEVWIISQEREQRV